MVCCLYVKCLLIVLAKTVNCASIYYFTPNNVTSNVTTLSRETQSDRSTSTKSSFPSSSQPSSSVDKVFHVERPADAAVFPPSAVANRPSVIHYHDVIDTSSPAVNRSAGTITKVSLYVGLIAFSVVAIGLCFIASMTASSQQNQSRCCARCRRFLRLRDNEPEPEVTSTTTTTTTVDSISGPAALLVEPRRACAVALYDVPPSYDEVMAMSAEIGTGSEYHGGTEEEETGSSSQSVFAASEDVEVGSVVSTRRLITMTSSSATGNGNVEVRAPVTSSRASNRTAAETTDDRSTSGITPPDYFQVIRDFASRGILINRALLATPPPTYAELLMQRRAAKARGRRPSTTPACDVTTVVTSALASSAVGLAMLPLTASSPAATTTNRE